MAKILIISLIFCNLFADFAVKSYKEVRNESVVRQNYEESCGASSVATLLNLTNLKRFSEKDILEVLEKNTNMLSFNELSVALNKLGFFTKAYKLSREIFNSIYVPIIVKIENDPRFPHFVVVNNIKGDFVKVYDPSFGEYLSLKKEFFSVWDKNNLGGYALIIKPNITKDMKLNLVRPSQIKE